MVGVLRAPAASRAPRGWGGGDGAGLLGDGWGESGVVEVGEDGAVEDR